MWEDSESRQQQKKREGEFALRAIFHKILIDGCKNPNWWWQGHHHMHIPSLAIKKNGDKSFISSQSLLNLLLKNLHKYLLPTVCTPGILCLYRVMGDPWGTRCGVFFFQFMLCSNKTLSVPQYVNFPRRSFLSHSTTEQLSPFHGVLLLSPSMWGTNRRGKTKPTKYPHKIRLPRDTKKPFSPKCGLSLKQLWDSRIYITQIWLCTSIDNQVTATWRSC